jgi:adenylate cyclase
MLHRRGLICYFYSRARLITQVPVEVRGSVIEAERESERFATFVRLGIVILIGGVLAALLILTRRFAPYVAVIYGINLAVSLLGALSLNRRIYRPWLSWVLTTLDVTVFLAVIELGPVGRSLPGNYTTALIGVWALFILFAVVSLRGSATLMIYATALTTLGLAAHLVARPVNTAYLDTAGDLEPLFDSAPNILRLALLSSTGLVLAISALRARQTLSRAASLARERANLSRYLPAPIVGLLAECDASELRRGKIQRAAILFADIRGFSAMSERLSPIDVAALLNSFRAQATRVIERQGGIVDKFIGDAVMGVFGVPDAGNADAKAAVLAARHLLELIDLWSAERVRDGQQSIRVGIGAHFGTVFAGVLGYEGRLEFTVVGDAVNIAQRVEALTKEIGVDILVTEDVLQAAFGDGTDFQDSGWQFVCRQPLRGRNSPVGLFSCRVPEEDSSRVFPEGGETPSAAALDLPTLKACQAASASAVLHGSC